MKTIVKIASLFLVVSTLFNCNNLNNNSNNIIGVKPGNILLEDDVKAVLAKYVTSSAYAAKFYDPSSPEYDERVKSLSWGDLVLVHNISINVPENDEWFYIASGVLPDGQILVVQTVNASTGLLVHGQTFFGENTDIVRFATKNEILDYSRNFLTDATGITAVYFNDGSMETGSLLHSWKYLVYKKTESKSSSELKGYVLLDPWIEQFKTNNRVLPTNGFLSKFGYNHRVFKFSDISFFNKTDKSGANITLEPID